ncbi:hypothetical protein [Amycolatopsis sp. NBC_01286]|uniref:hypothetical protein n=1 Tax=Amycolatopsis sp. NBC_01286 TaxID=2903560 RepID=UPI002E15C451|nr:hypothetical protein OG570_47885 [Amycolatopsis sp. NBC_01286]
MSSFWTALIAVLGTLSGVLTTQFFGRRAATRAEEFAHRGQVRADRLSAYVAFLESLSDCRWACLERWHRERDATGSERMAAAVADYYRRITVVRHALWRVKMVAGEPGIVEMAEQALAAVRRIREAADTGQVDELAAASVGKADEFVARAAVEVG